MIGIGIGFTSRSISTCINSNILTVFDDKIVKCNLNGECTAIQGPKYGILYVVGDQVFVINCDDKTIEHLGAVNNMKNIHKWKVTLTPKHCKCTCSEIAEYFDEISKYFSDASLYINVDARGGYSIDHYNKYNAYIALRSASPSSKEEYIYVPFNKDDLLTSKLIPFEILGEPLPYGYAVSTVLMFNKEYVKKQLLSHEDIEASGCTASDKNEWLHNIEEELDNKIRKAFPHLFKDRIAIPFKKTYYIPIADWHLAVVNSTYEYPYSFYLVKVSGSDVKIIGRAEGAIADNVYIQPQNDRVYIIIPTYRQKEILYCEKFEGEKICISYADLAEEGLGEPEYIYVYNGIYVYECNSNTCRFLGRTRSTDMRHCINNKCKYAVCGKTLHIIKINREADKIRVIKSPLTRRKRRKV